MQQDHSDDSHIKDGLSSACLFKVLLVILFCHVEVPKWGDMCVNGTRLLQLLDFAFNCFLLFLVLVPSSRSVLNRIRLRSDRVFGEKYVEELFV